MKRLLCFFGFHTYKRRVFAYLKFIHYTIYEEVCKRCNYCPTWEAR